MLIYFDRLPGAEGVRESDCREKFGNLMMHPLRLICGQTLEVHPTFVRTKETDKTVRLAAAFFYYVFWRITLPMTLLGLFFTFISGSYHKTSSAVERQLEALQGHYHHHRRFS